MLGIFVLLAFPILFPVAVAFIAVGAFFASVVGAIFAMPESDADVNDVIYGATAAIIVAGLVLAYFGAAITAAGLTAVAGIVAAIAAILDAVLWLISFTINNFFGFRDRGDERLFERKVYSLALR